MPPQLRTSRRYYLLSQRLAARAARQSRRQRTIQGVASVVIAYQAAQANEAQAAVGAMLTEQRIKAPADLTLAPLAFTTTPQAIAGMLDGIEVEARALYTSWQFDRLVRSLVQDAGRAAQGVATASRPRVGWVRHLNLPSCSRCAVLAGRIYRYSDGFQRHPGCDCTMTPTSMDSGDMTYDPEQLVREGLVTGLSRADQRALAEGADFNQIVNVQGGKAGLTESGRVLSRGDRPTPEGIFRSTNSRTEAVDALRRHGYLR